MRVLLISANACKDPCPVFPLGIAAVAGALESAGHEVRQADVLLHDIAGEIETFRPDAIGIGMRNLDTVNSLAETPSFLRDTENLIALCRKHSKARIILGGSGFSQIPETLSAHLDCDFAIAGEGGRAFTELLAGNFSGPKLIRGSADFQYRTLYQPDILAYYAAKTHMIPVQTKRGCPFHCVYCAYPYLEGASIRERSVPETAETVRRLAETHPDSMIYFVDSIFNDPGKLFRRFLRELGRNGKKISFTGFLTPSGLSEEDCGLLAEAGMVSAELGLDAASDRTLAGLGKNFTFAEAAEACRRLRRHGITVTTNVMFGGPGETMETVREGIENLRTLVPARTLVFCGIRILPGAPIFRRAVEEKLVPPDWNGLDSRYYFAPGLDAVEVHKLLAEAFGSDSYILYPPHRKNGLLRKIHEFGYLRLRKLQEEPGKP